MTSDLYLKFPDQPTALEVLRPLGMTYVADVYARDENGEYIYNTLTFQDVEYIYDEDDEENDDPIETRLLFDENGEPIMGESKTHVMVKEEKISQGSHQFALWEVGEIIGVDGWHINLRIIDVNFDVSGLEAYAVEPKHPVCVWA
jgi:hypothetical protein